MAPPAWLPDNATVLLSGLSVAEAPRVPAVRTSSQPAGLLTPGTAVAPLSPSGLHLTVAERASLRIGQLTDGGTSVQDTSLRDGGTLPEVDGDGHVAYLVLDPRLPDAGRVWFTGIPLPASLGSPVSTQVVPDNRALESSVSFAPQTLWLVVAREPLHGRLASSHPTHAESFSERNAEPKSRAASHSAGRNVRARRRVGPQPGGRHQHAAEPGRLAAVMDPVSGAS